MNIQDFKSDFAKAIEFLKTDISGLRTGRASTAIVEDLPVEAYGTRQPLKSLATILVPDAKTVVVELWDKSQMQNVEKAIRDSNLGINPVNNGKQIILSMPSLTFERRHELIKVLHQKLENTRIAIRKSREETREFIIEAEKNKEVTEDEKFKLFDDLETMVKEFNDKTKEIGDKKEEEINNV
jgi:ribosome recycling factor